MLLLEIITLVMTIPFASVYLSSILLHTGVRIAFLILKLDGLLSYNTLYEAPLLLSSWVYLLGGLLQTSQYLGPTMHDTVLSILVPIMIYSNASTEKSQIISDNKGKAGIYLWSHRESNKMYVGSAVDLSKRLSKYYSSSELKQVNNYISRALIVHTHSEFSLSILEYIDISNLSIDEVRELILSREQHNIDSLEPEYNILKKAGSSLGYKHTAESLAKFSGDNHPMYGKTHSAETLAKLSVAMYGENNPFYGKTHTAKSIAKMSEAKSGIPKTETHKAKISEAMSGKNHPMYGKSHTAETIALMSLAKKGKTLSAGTKAKMSAAKGTTVYIYSSNDSTLIYTFPSSYKAAEHFNCGKDTILRYIKNGKLFKGEYILSYKPKIE
jgi:group I intron endonuclease